MKLSFLMWLASLLPQSAADPLCLATTVYLEARDQSELGQRAVAEVALRRREDGRWGESVCEVVTAPKQFAPTLVNPNFRMGNLEAWQQAMDVAFKTQQNWEQPIADRHEVVPGASHFAALRYASPSWRHYPTVATIGSHTFYRVDRLSP
ncbi:cell wall hydrolase [Arenimonas sp.]|uniref:cell wall hydrolase n=1 Tax=Arenimonas sp. TaxID=1872635 RepID=UPI0039E4CC3D